MTTIPAFATIAKSGEAPPAATAHVLDFLQRYPDVERLLQEAEGPLRTAFGLDVTLALAVETDPEMPDWDYLMAGIHTTLPLEDVQACLQAFDKNWWLEQTSRAQDKLLFDLVVI